jgi:hypothetical protein
LSTQACRVRGRDVAMPLRHEPHWDPTDDMWPKIFHGSGRPDRLGTALRWTESRALELTYELLCLRGSVLSDGRNRLGQTISKKCLDSGYRGIAWVDPDEDDDPGGGQ